MKTLSFLNIKGGVGKSSTSIVVSHILASKYKKKVLVIDTDPQANTSMQFASIPVMDYLNNFISGEAFESNHLTIEDILTNSKADINQAIRHTEYENLDILPSFITLAEAEERLKADVSTPQQFRLKNHLKKIEDKYEYCIIDCSPSISIININALVCTDYVFIPMKADLWSGAGCITALNLINTVSAYADNLNFAGGIFTSWEQNKNVNKTALEILSQILGEKVMKTKIPKSKLVEEMSYVQQPLLAYDSGKEKSKVTQAYLSLVDEILELIK